MLTLGAMAAAVVTCLYFFNMLPAGKTKSGDSKTPVPATQEKSATGFGRRTR
jgi:hypothetical protein